MKCSRQAAGVSKNYTPKYKLFMVWLYHSATGISGFERRSADKIHDKQLRRCAVQLQYSGTGILGSFRHGHTDIGVLPEPGGQQAHNTQGQKGLKKPEPYRQAERVQDEMKKKAGIAAAIIPIVVVAAALVYNRQMSELNRWP